MKQVINFRYVHLNWETFLESTGCMFEPGCSKEYENDWDSQIALKDFYNWTAKNGFLWSIKNRFLGGTEIGIEESTGNKALCAEQMYGSEKRF